MGRLHLGRIKWLKVTQESGADQGLHTSFLMSRPVVLGQKASEVNSGGFLNHTKSYPVKSLNGLDCQLSGLGLEGTPHSHWSAAVNYQMTLQRWWACINIWLLYLLWNILTIEWKKNPILYISPLLLFKNSFADIYPLCLCQMVQFVTDAEFAKRKVNLIDKAPGFLSLPFPRSRCLTIITKSWKAYVWVKSVWKGMAGVGGRAGGTGLGLQSL